MNSDSLRMLMLLDDNYRNGVIEQIVSTET